MPDWDTKLEVKVGQQTVTPIETFTPTFNTPYRTQHSLEKENIGWVRQPFNFTFSMTVRAIGDAVARLTKMALEGTEFDITVTRAENSPGNQWSFQDVIFKRCFITSASPSNVTLQDSPTATFNCICLAYDLQASGNSVTNT